MNYSVMVLPSAERDLIKLPLRAWERIRVRIDSLMSNPRPVGSQKLHGRIGEFRVRSGDYRVLYRVDDKAKRVIIYGIGHRRDVYR